VRTAQCRRLSPGPAGKRRVGAATDRSGSVEGPCKGRYGKYSRPGGNITGVSSAVEDYSRKQVELLTKIFPGLKGFAYLAHPDSPLFKRLLEHVESAAGRLRLRLLVQRARNYTELTGAMEGTARAGLRAIIAINRRTAAAIGVNLPQEIVLRADEVIE
jgi:ABC-type uncharacterized transport system substrate-binding protein